MNKSVVFRYVLPSIGVLMAFCLFSGWGMAEKTVQAGARYADKAELDAVKADLGKIDGYAASGAYENASVIAGQDIKARGIYKAYLERASKISTELLWVRKRLDLQDKPCPCSSWARYRNGLVWITPDLKVLLPTGRKNSRATS